MFLWCEPQQATEERRELLVILDDAKFTVATTRICRYNMPIISSINLLFLIDVDGLVNVAAVLLIILLANYTNVADLLKVTHGQTNTGCFVSFRIELKSLIFDLFQWQTTDIIIFEEMISVNWTKFACAFPDRV